MKRRCAEEDENGNDPVVVKYVAPSTIYYRGEIKEPEATKFIVKLRKAAKNLEHSKLSIVVYLSSHGGDAHAGISMYEHICDVKRTCPVTVVADGYCASAATLPLIAATRRVMFHSSTVLVHAITSFPWGGYKPKQLREEADNCDTLMNVLVTIYQQHCKLKTSKLKRLLEKDQLLTFEQCLQMGFVDGSTVTVTKA